MIRVLLGSALPLIGLGVAAAMLGPDLVTGPRGEPMIMAAGDQASLQAATFDGKACPSALLFADPSEAGAPAPGGTRIVAFALRSGTNDVAVAIEDFSGGDRAKKTVVLVFDAEGNLIAAGDPALLPPPAGEEVASDCATGSTPVAPI
jgi:hypothetical protein